MSILGRSLSLFLAMAFGMIAGGIVVPVAWAVVRILGLIPILASLLGRWEYLIWSGGIIFGAPVGTLAVSRLLRAMGEEDQLALVAATIGGAIGGLASSIMFFPIVGIL